MKIVISPYSKGMRNGQKNPKNYPYWNEVIHGLKDHNLVQIGVEGEAPLIENTLFSLHPKELWERVKDADLFISVDNFSQHFFSSLWKERNCNIWEKRPLYIWISGKY